MLRRVAIKAMRVGRAAVFTVGLAVILAVALGVANAALTASVGDPFLLGKFNAVDKITRLVGTSTVPCSRWTTTTPPARPRP